MIPAGNTELIAQYSRQLGYTRGGRQFVYRTIGLGQLQTVLEVGCGAGELTAELDRACRGGAAGCDIDPRMIELARRAYPGLRFERSDPAALPFDDAEFDLACTHFTLMWADDPAALLHEMRRVVRPGGWVAALAEPDYGAGIYQPGAGVAAALEQALSEQGAHTRLGRMLPALFKDAGFDPVIRGALQSSWDESQTRAQAEAETRLVCSTLAGSFNGIEQWAEQFVQAAQSGRALVFMPLFFALGRKR